MELGVSRDRVKFVRTEGVAFRNLGDEGVLVHPESGELIGVNATGAVVLEQLQAAPVDAATIKRAVKEEFDTDDCDADVDGFLAELLSMGVIVRVEE